MEFTPQQFYDNVRESLAQYLETQYKLSHPVLVAERRQLLRELRAVAQIPFVEATPSFKTTRKLAELERQHPEILPAGLAELVTFGVKVNKNDLYEHQERALLAAYDKTAPNLLVATGTGSGKTEAFLLPILSDVLREAKSWLPVSGSARRGEYSDRAGWLHSRRHERRPAALRAVILYPMNALVSDQLARLRRILAVGDSPGWQRENLGGNVIHFGMYTSATPIAGLWTDDRRRNTVDTYLHDLESEWNELRSELQETGAWARPDSPEMLLRWDMQFAPPDIMVTNYSMLEYMLVRPIENKIFETTREWLTKDANAQFTLVLDEAHTYTGAKGTEVAHLVRRLKERLGLTAGSGKFRAIATTASVPSNEEKNLRGFVGDLFGEPAGRFTLIEARAVPPLSGRGPVDDRLIEAWKHFHGEFRLTDPLPGMNRLSAELALGQVSPAVKPEAAMYELVKSDPLIEWIRNRTARRATPLNALADECWGDIGSPEDRQRATAGLLAAGSFARKDGDENTPPLISMRLHAFFRGIPGIWACLDPNCRACTEETRGNRPVGRLYLDPRPWCDCGGRVLELFTCRYCGLSFLAGVPDSLNESLWPWSDDLSGERQDPRNFRPFAVERPDDHSDAWKLPSHRSTRTTRQCHKNDEYAREVWEIEPQNGGDDDPNYFPKQCPRCRHWRNDVRDREVVEPLRTRGVQSFANIVEESFRFQSRSSHLAPNFGRKALVFSDSRAEASRLAQDLKDNHSGDIFRQILYRVLVSCDACEGKGTSEERSGLSFRRAASIRKVPCTKCGGTGKAGQIAPLAYDTLKSRVIGLQIDRGIDPTRQRFDKFFQRVSETDPSAYDEATRHFNAALRREVTEEQFGLEPQGIARWRIPLRLNGQEIVLKEENESFEHLSIEESNLLVQSVARLLATENVVTAPEPNSPWDWGKDASGKELVDLYRRRVLVRGGRNQDLGFRGKAIAFTFTDYYKLGRYTAALARKLRRLDRIGTGEQEEAWINHISDSLWDVLKDTEILSWAGAKVERPGRMPQNPQGIRLSRFVLHPISDTVDQCTACAYVMAEALLGICIRCGHDTQTVASEALTSYFRRVAMFADPSTSLDDPYPLKASEHTAQIASREARDEERWFQDQFRDDCNPRDYRVDVLSVTTTMEMGIDIGSLLFVGLRNVPPTVANYQQRAGRAGRRGSALATVFTFAQSRNHDQYYFERPPEIISDPPRIPTIHLDNQVIARRHVRSLILQSFFLEHTLSIRGNLFESWGTTGDFVAGDMGDRLQQYIANFWRTLLDRTLAIVDERVASEVTIWLGAISEEVTKIAESRDPAAPLFGALIAAGLLPKYAFPIDVVSLTIPKATVWRDEDQFIESFGTDDLQRDLKIAIAEYAPGAEVTRQTDQVTYKYRSVGLNDPFNRQPNYVSDGLIMDCFGCQSVSILQASSNIPTACAICDSDEVVVTPYIRPRGFTVDGSLENAGRQIYESGSGSERSGNAGSARLQVGGYSFLAGRPVAGYQKRLFSHIHIGSMLITNRGPERNGYQLCPSCGRLVDAEDTKPHRRPADVPPHSQYRFGPRAGTMCPARPPWPSKLILGHPFTSEALLLGINLPATLDAPFSTPGGQAAWLSFGTLLANAATKILQIDPGELKVGARAVRTPDSRLQGEVFIYDDVPGGAGYARTLGTRLGDVMSKALELGEHCPNSNCAGACYRCMFDYRNQMLHAKLDRFLGVDLLRYVLNGALPSLDPGRVARAVAGLEEYARSRFNIEPGWEMPNGTEVSVVLRDKSDVRYGLIVTHTLAAKPRVDRLSMQQATEHRNVVLVSQSVFDLEKRPFWVVNEIASKSSAAVAAKTS